MLNRYLHHIDQDGLASYRSTGGRLQPIARHSLDGEGQEAFAHWLQCSPTGSHTLLANLPDEGFQQENIPHVSGADRKALIGRKLAQQFYGSAYTTSLSLGRESEGRKDERILLTGITRPAALDPWLEILHKHEAAVTALYTPALLTRALLQALRPAAKRGLIVSFSKAGIRQIYFDEGRLRFSRLSPAPEGEFSEWGSACLRETQKTLQYLSAQRWITRSSRLPVWLLLAREDFAPLLASVEHATQLEFQLCNIDTLSRQLGQREATGSSDSQALMMHLALRERSAPQLAPETSRRIFRFWQVRRAIIWSGLLLACALSLAALKNHLETREIQQHSQALQSDAAQENRRYQQLLASLPPQPAPLETLRSMSDVHTRLSGTKFRPLDALQPLSQSLDAFPEIELKSLSWQHSLPQPGASGKPAEVLTLTLEAGLPLTAASTPRAAIERIRAFAADLRPHFSEIKLAELPFNAESDQTLSSNAASQRSQPVFKLSLSLMEKQP